MASMESLGELLQEELKDIYDAEKQLTKALPKLAKKASASELQEAFEDHLRQTEQHVERLEQVFDQPPVLGQQPGVVDADAAVQHLFQLRPDALRPVELVHFIM